MFELTNLYCKLYRMNVSQNSVFTVEYEEYEELI